MNKDSKVSLHTGNRMPIMGLGTWKLTKDTADIIDYALDLDYKMIDTSSDYGSQPGVGEGIKKSNVSRKNFYLVTKVEETDDAYARTKSNLKELGLDFVDLSLIHRPPKTGVGVELWEGLIQAKKDGLTRDIGVSNYSIMQIEELIEATGEIPVVNQIEWSPFGYSQEMKRYCADRNIVIQAYSPLTHGKRLDDETLEKIAKNYDKNTAQIMIRWNLQQGSVPLAKANVRKHLEENIDVFDFEINDEDMRTLSGLNEKYSSLGELPYV